MQASRMYGLGVAIVLVCGSAALGQAGATGARIQKSLPFTMAQTETRVQTLADGATVTHVTIIRTMRDSQGRTRTERIMSGGFEFVRRDGEDNYMRRRGDMVQINVVDPVAGTTMSWSDNSPGQYKMVTLRHNQQNQVMPTAGANRQPMVPPGSLSGPEAVQRHEDLGIKTMQGVYVRGTRTTTTYPAGFDGNTAAYTAMNEYWRSDDLNGMWMEFSNNQLGTKSTTTLDSYTPGEPDASLFQAPVGYTVWDVAANSQ